jgi:hypothetical protein
MAAHQHTIAALDGLAGWQGSCRLKSRVNGVRRRHPLRGERISAAAQWFT